VCGWRGLRFRGRAHCEFAKCPACDSIARDRFLHHCFVRQVPWRDGLTVLETSPRLGPVYRQVMAERMDYTASDLDQSLHAAPLSIDLQDIALPDDSYDAVLTAHVLEHVPDTDVALKELHRITRPGGSVLLQVPLLQPWTAPPIEPEFHEDNTPVHWRFGVDLTDRARDAGFEAAMMVTEDLARRVADRDASWRDIASEFDAAGLVHAMRTDELSAVATAREARRMGFEPSYMFVTWAFHKSGPA
jgi:SAM-dependent methyltransferase